MRLILKVNIGIKMQIKNSCVPNRGIAAGQKLSLQRRRLF